MGLCHILQFPDGAMTAIPDQAVVGKEHKWSLSEDVCVCVCVHINAPSCSYLVRLFATPWTGAHQAPLSMGFSGGSS